MGCVARLCPPVQRWGGVKAFAATTAGKAALIALMVVTLIGGFLYLGPYLVSITFLVFGMLVPIYLGWKRPRQLALAGLIALLIAAPLTAPLEAAALLQPSPLASSDPVLPYGNGSAVIQNAKVTPFNAAAGGTFNFTAQLFPQYIPKGDSALLWVTLWVSTCPGATGNSSTTCASGYPLYVLNRTFPNGTATPGSVSFLQTLPGNNIWWWVMGGAVRNVTTQKLFWIFVDPGNSYGAVQGPVTGDFLSTYEYVLPAVYLSLFGLAGIVFFAALLVYALFKSREARRKIERARPIPPIPGGGSGPLAPSGGPPPPSTTVERTCPNCQAVVYPNESSCWKCGSSLPPASSSTPLS
jgi:hypothetical protein